VRRVRLAPILDELEARPNEFPQELLVELLKTDGPVVIAFDHMELAVVIFEAWEAPDRMGTLTFDEEAGD